MNRFQELRFTDQVGPLHFVGIGGIGMSGIATLLHDAGYTVRGSDLAMSEAVSRMRASGIAISLGHHAEQVRGAGVVVVSSAVGPDNPEVRAARERRIPVVRRSDMLGELMRLKRSIGVSGSHGKTTTTTFVGALLEKSGLDPTIINGGIIKAFGSNMRMGKGEWIVVEADESDGSFLRLPSDIVLVTNIDREHLDHYGSFDALRAAFRETIERIPFHSFAVLCLDDPEVAALAGAITDRRVITYGQHPDADVLMHDYRNDGIGSRFGIVSRLNHKTTRINEVYLPIPGQHNALNALGACALALELGLAPEPMVSALASFSGVKRRFEPTGSYRGALIYDDYAHHPAEIRATLDAARPLASGRLVAVFQPHRYSRLQVLMDDFCLALERVDALWVLPVYGAGEAPIQGVDAQKLVAELHARGQRQAAYVETYDALIARLRPTLQSGDLVLCMGAGSIGTMAWALPSGLRMDEAQAC